MLKPTYFGDPPFMETPPWWVNRPSGQQHGASSQWTGGQRRRRICQKETRAWTAGHVASVVFKKTSQKKQDLTTCGMAISIPVSMARAKTSTPAELHGPPNPGPNGFQSPNRPPHMGLSKKWAPQKSNASKVS